MASIAWCLASRQGDNQGNNQGVLQLGLMWGARRATAGYVVGEREVGCGDCGYN